MICNSLRLYNIIGKNFGFIRRVMQHNTDFKIDLVELVSIVIPSCRMDSFLMTCIEEINKIYPLINIIIVLDESINDKNYNLPNNVKVITSTNQKISYKRNLGAESTNTKYIAFIDSDAYPKSGWLENAILFLETNKDYSAVTGPQSHPPTDNFFQHCNRIVRYMPLFNHAEWLMITDKKAVDHDCTYAVTANLIITKKDYLELDGLNENLYIAEDNEFCNRLTASGRKIRFLSTVSIFHRERHLKSFLLHIFSMASYYANSFKSGIRIKTKKQSILQFIPLLVVVLFIILYLIFLAKKFDMLLILGLLILIFIILVFQSAKGAYKLNKHKIFGFVYLLFVSIMFSFIWVAGTFYGLMKNDEFNPYKTYKH